MVVCLGKMCHKHLPNLDSVSEVPISSADVRMRNIFSPLPTPTDSVTLLYVYLGVLSLSSFVVKNFNIRICEVSSCFFLCTSKGVMADASCYIFFICMCSTYIYVHKNNMNQMYMYTCE